MDTETFERVQKLLSAKGRPAVERKPRRSPRAYVLRGLLHCGVCARRMEASWNNGRTHYRCKFPTEYALANKIEHPRTVYVREDHILGELDTWLCQVFAPVNLRRTVETLLEARDSEADRVAIETAKRTVDDCDRRMARYRTTLDAGGDPEEIGRWMAETRAERLKAEGSLRAVNRKKEVMGLIPRLAEMTEVLKAADPADRNDLYTQMGLHLTYEPSERVVVVEARPSMYRSTCPRGDLNPHAPQRALAPQASASAYSATRTWCLHAGPSSRVGSVRLANSEGCVIPVNHPGVAALVSCPPQARVVGRRGSSDPLCPDTSAASLTTYWVSCEKHLRQRWVLLRLRTVEG